MQHQIGELIDATQISDERAAISQKDHQLFIDLIEEMCGVFH